MTPHNNNPAPLPLRENANPEHQLPHVMRLMQTQIQQNAALLQQLLETLGGGLPTAPTAPSPATTSETTAVPEPSQGTEPMEDDDDNDGADMPPAGDLEKKNPPQITTGDRLSPEDPPPAGGDTTPQADTTESSQPDEAMEDEVEGDAGGGRAGAAPAGDLGGKIPPETTTDGQPGSGSSLPSGGADMADDGDAEDSEPPVPTKDGAQVAASETATGATPSGSGCPVAPEVIPDSEDEGENEDEVPSYLSSDAGDAPSPPQSSSEDLFGPPVVAAVNSVEDKHRQTVSPGEVMEAPHDEVLSLRLANLARQIEEAPLGDPIATRGDTARLFHEGLTSGHRDTVVTTANMVGRAWGGVVSSFAQPVFADLRDVIRGGSFREFVAACRAFRDIFNGRASPECSAAEACQVLVVVAERVSNDQLSEYAAEGALLCLLGISAAFCTGLKSDMSAEHPRLLCEALMETYGISHVRGTWPDACELVALLLQRSPSTFAPLVEELDVLPDLCVGYENDGSNYGMGQENLLFIVHVMAKQSGVVHECMRPFVAANLESLHSGVAALAADIVIHCGVVVEKPDPYMAAFCQEMVSGCLAGEPDDSGFVAMVLRLARDCRAHGSRVACLVGLSDWEGACEQLQSPIITNLNISFVTIMLTTALNNKEVRERILRNRDLYMIVSRVISGGEKVPTDDAVALKLMMGKAMSGGGRMARR